MCASLRQLFEYTELNTVHRRTTGRIQQFAIMIWHFTMAQAWVIGLLKACCFKQRDLFEQTAEHRLFCLDFSCWWIPVESDLNLGSLIERINLTV